MNRKKKCKVRFGFVCSFVYERILKSNFLQSIFAVMPHKSDLENGKSAETNRLNMAPGNESYELVYANLDFTNPDSASKPPTSQVYQATPHQQLSMHMQAPMGSMQQIAPIATQASQQFHPNMAASMNPLQVPPKKQPPATRPKPAFTRPLGSNATNSNGIEYAKLQFATKADL